MTDTRIPHARGTTAVSLNALRAFESAARHLSFTLAARELAVTQAAVSHQVKGLEDRLGVKLFRRTSRGLVITDEGYSLLPTLNDAFARLNRLVSQFDGSQRREVLTIGVVGTFLLGWLLARLPDFHARYPFVDLRLLANNNRVDLAGEALDGAIRFGDGLWNGLEAERIMRAPLTLLCSPPMAQRLTTPTALAGETLLRPYRPQDWPAWLAAAGIPDLPIRGPVFDSSPLMVQAAALGHGAALVPAVMFERELRSGALVRPFDVEVEPGAYWLTRPSSRAEGGAAATFRTWLMAGTP